MELQYVPSMVFRLYIKIDLIRRNLDFNTKNVCLSYSISLRNRHSFIFYVICTMHMFHFWKDFFCFLTVNYFSSVRCSIINQYT